MAKKFSVIKKKDLLSGEERIVAYSLGDDELSRTKVLKKLHRSLRGKDGVFSYRCDESLYMHLLPGLSETTVRELSKRLYRTAYVVCKKTGKSEKALYLALLKDSALRFKASIPAATLKDKGADVPNPDFYVKELRLCL